LVMLLCSFILKLWEIISYIICFPASTTLSFCQTVLVCWFISYTAFFCAVSQIFALEFKAFHVWWVCSSQSSR
jgi:hypothetical protein